MRRDLVVYIIIFILFSINSTGQNILCFTHPMCNIDESISLYSEPDVYKCELYVDGEAGYEVDAIRKEENYILISHLPVQENPIWISIGDLGVVVQNYDRDSIPMYIQPDSLSFIQTFLVETYIAILYDWTEKFVKVQIEDSNMNFIGWIDRRYICGSPYTTCNQ